LDNESWFSGFEVKPGIEPDDVMIIVCLPNTFAKIGERK
jgi:hypothetical protein